MKYVDFVILDVSGQMGLWKDTLDYTIKYSKFSTLSKFHYKNVRLHSNKYVYFQSIRSEIQNEKRRHLIVLYFQKSLIQSYFHSGYSLSIDAFIIWSKSQEKSHLHKSNCVFEACVGRPVENCHWIKIQRSCVRTT